MDGAIKSKAIKLRLSGKTYTEINKRLHTKIPKSTLSTWFANLKMTTNQKKILEQNVAKKIKRSQIIARLVLKKKRQNYLDKLRTKNLHLLKLLSNDIQKLLLSILYLGEGAKSKSTQFLCLGNSNPKVILLYFSLLYSCFEIDRSKFRVRIQCRADQNVKEIENYWQRITRIPRKQFYPTYIDKRTIGKPTLHKSYKGVCTIHYFDRSIQYELEFLYDSVIKYIILGR